MKRTRLFHTLILCGAALTGGSATLVVTAAAVAGCGDDTTTAPNIIDMGVRVDMAHDMAHPFPTID